MSKFRLPGAVLLLLVAGVIVLSSSSRLQAGDNSHKRPGVVQVIVPDEDRFSPFAVTIRVGQWVTWVNNDTDDHTIVSDDAFNTAGHRGLNVVLPANGGTYSLKFKHAGVFPYYCRFHSMLDSANQPIAPGPDGGIQNPDGNFGTPMSGVVTVVGDED
jgi:plastocyanin